MKTLVILLVTVITIFSCNSNSKPEETTKLNTVVLFKVDYTTNVFEAAKELEFTENSNFTISSTYVSPGDFGNLKLYYQELNEMIFDGTIIWAGLGERSFPTQFDSPTDFPTTDITSPLPDIDMFENVIYDESAFYPDVINYMDLWNSISNLEILQEYLSSNPTGKINLFLYTPSVGIGDPADWDWYVILKK